MCSACLWANEGLKELFPPKDFIILMGCFYPPQEVGKSKEESNVHRARLKLPEALPLVVCVCVCVLHFICDPKCVRGPALLSQGWAAGFLCLCFVFIFIPLLVCVFACCSGAGCSGGGCSESG